MMKQVYKPLGAALIALTCWMPVKAQLSQSFGGTFPPAGWAVFDNGIETTKSWGQRQLGVSNLIASLPNVAGGAGAQDWLVSPAIPITATAFNLVYWERKPGTTGVSSTYNIMISTSSQTAAATFSSATTYSAISNTAFTKRIVDLSAYVGQTVYIGWLHTSTTTSMTAGWFLDDVSLLGVCANAPTGVTLTATSATSATVAWTGGQAGSNYQVRWAKAGSAASTATTASNPFTMTGLQGSQAYTVSVRQICGVGDSSLWSAPVSFTAGTCQAPTGLAASGITSTSAVLTWTGSPTYELNYGADYNGAATSTLTLGTSQYTLTGLTSGTNYSIAVRSYCSVGDTSLWSSLVEFNTSCLSNPVPWSESFETKRAPSEPVCWTASEPHFVVYDTGSPGSPAPARTGNNYLVTLNVNKDTIFTPAVTLSAGVMYQFSFWYAHVDLFFGSSGDSLYMMVNSQPGGSPTARRIGIIKPVTNNTYLKFQTAFTPTVSGDYYFGVGAKAGNFTIYTMDDFTVTQSITYSTSVTNACTSASGAATLHVNGGLPPYTVDWSNGATTQTVTNLAPGPYTYTLTDANATTQTGSITIAAVLAPLVSATTSKTLICVGESVVLTASGASTYSWSTGQTTASISVSPTAISAYTVTGSANGCSNTAIIIQNVSTCTGIEEQDATSAVRLYPNPNSGQVTVELHQGNTALLELYDSVGRLVLKVALHPGYNQLSTEKLDSGLYIYRITDKNTTLRTGRMVRQ